jgi:hypothetical protein
VYFALPNIEIRTKGIEASDVAIVPPDDPRVRSEGRAHSAVRKYLQQFREPFGTRFRPSVLIVNDDALGSVRAIDALQAFRDALAISVISKSCARMLPRQRGTGTAILYSDYFEFHPVMISNDYEYLIVSTLALTSLDDIDRFSGQSSPKFARQCLTEHEIDWRLFDSVVSYWERLFVQGEDNPPAQQIFRSLAMAYHGCAHPLNGMPTLHDLGPILGAWVAAFETLTHPGPGQSVSFAAVSAALDQIPWVNSELRATVHSVSWKGCRDVTLASSLYKRIYDARNRFLHGEAVGNELVQIPARVRIRAVDAVDRRFLLLYAPIIFRALLLNQVGNRIATVTDDQVTRANAARIAKVIAAQLEERLYESALLSVAI